MKRILFWLLTVCLLTIGATAQTANQISDNRREVQQINKKLSRLSKKSFDVSGVSAEGAKAILYKDKNAIRKISAQIFGETGRSIVELFYKDENLIFAFERQSIYNKPFGKVVQNLEKRFYFENGALIQIVDGKMLLTEKNENFGEARDRILSLSKDLLESTKKKH